VRLDRIDIPGEHEARERTWEVLRAAFAEREPVPRSRLRLAPALSFAVLAAAVVAAFTPPGRAVVDKVREAIGVEAAEQTLFALPADGRLLAVADSGAWAVSRDGSKRRLGDYREASCSPFGRFVVAARENELAALEPDGDVRWKLARPNVHSPAWGGTRTDTRIAYVSRGVVHVIAGDGTGDRAVVGGHAVAWRPGGEHVLAVAMPQRVALLGDRGWIADVSATALQWSADGSRLLATGPAGYVVLSAAGRVLEQGKGAAAFGPRGRALAVVGPGNAVRVGGRMRFQSTGTFRDLTWSPDGRWVAFVWPEADQIVFVTASGARRIEAAANLTAQFEGTTAPRIAGWCAASP
jgi:hypothetical protein